MLRVRLPNHALFAALAILSAACGGGSDDAPPGAPDGGAEPDAALADAGGGGEVDGAVAPDGSTLADAGPLPIADSGPGPGNGDSGVSVPRPPDPGVISWRTCADTRECGSMEVPIDYADPASGTLRLAVMRRRASGQRVGTLLINPGGPGSSAIDFLGFFVDESSSPLLARFDLVAFDPRGIGYSTPLDCHATLQQLIATDPSPDDESEWQAIEAAAAKFALDCQQAHGALLPHLHTVNVARDMEQVRAALGEAKLNYLGLSYGTAIGARYAELFPDKVGRMVLDGALDLELTALDLAREQAKGFERALGQYFAWCTAGADRCPWTRGAAPAQAYASLSAAVEMQPIPVMPPVDRPLGPGELLTGVSALLYTGDVGWRALSPALDKAVGGDASSLMEYVDGYLQRELDGSYTNREEANHAVNCLDRKPLSVAEIRAAAPSFAAESPIFGVPGLTGQLVCAHWAVAGQNGLPPHAPLAPPIVVIGTLGDPATPYAWAEALAGDLASSVLLTASGEGHTAYGRGDPCIDGTVNAYLFDGVVPTRNQCGPSMLAPRLFAPASARWRMRLRR